jgi:hypothetical protein
MTEIILKNNIDKNKIDALLSFLKSWGLDAEIRTSNVTANKKSKKFTLSAGIWKDYNVSADNLRKQAWQRNV